jgi:hypothetical protein
LERLLRRCRTAEDRQRLYEAETGLYEAKAFWDQGDGPARWELEARLLTTESWETVASKVGLTPLGVEYIEKLYFHVRDKFEATSWISHKAVRVWTIPPEAPEFLGAYWRMLAFNAGPLVLDAVVRALTTGSVADLDDPNEFRRLVLIKASYAMHTISLDDPRRAMRFVRLCLRIMDVLDACDVPELDELMRNHADAFLEQLDQTFRGDAAATLAASSGTESAKIDTEQQTTAVQNKERVLV